MAGDGSYALVRQMMAMPFCHMHGPERHVIQSLTTMQLTLPETGVQASNAMMPSP